MCASQKVQTLPFRIFRGPLFHKPVTGQELFFAVSYSKPALVETIFVKTTLIVETAFVETNLNICFILIVKLLNRNYEDACASFVLHVGLLARLKNILSPGVKLKILGF